MKPESETKRKLLETAVELIWESSYGSVSVDDICTKAGVNKGSFYYAFKSKSDLAMAALERFWEAKRPFSTKFSPLSSLLSNASKPIAISPLLTRRRRPDQFGKVLGCPFCSLGIEQSTQDENIRQKVEQMSARNAEILRVARARFCRRGPDRDPRPGRSWPRKSTFTSSVS